MRPGQHVVVVGTNGKTSTATYLARFLRESGRRSGLYTSPHLRRWTERIKIDLADVAEATFETVLLRTHELAAMITAEERAEDLRFFDVLTVAAEDIFGREQVDVAVFEAGIGGRLDATRALEPELVVLTSIGEDHEELLGRQPEQRLREKALAAPPGSTLVSAPLEPQLQDELIKLGDEHGIKIVLTEEPSDSRGPSGPTWHARNLALAEKATELIVGARNLPCIETDVVGRWQEGLIGATPYVLDVAHNATAWQGVLDNLPARRHVLVVAITDPRPVEELIRILSAAADRVLSVVATTTTVRPARSPVEVASALVARGIDATAVEDPTSAFAAATATAEARGAPLAVFGSNFLAVDFLAWLSNPSVTHGARAPR
jgi:dihydrofolate synthase / folylpolyglutamate synthase